MGPGSGQIHLDTRGHATTGWCSKSPELPSTRGQSETSCRRPRMTTLCGRIPPGPAEQFSTTQNLLGWMGEQFLRYGDTYKAAIYGISVYATRNPQHDQHVLHENSRN